MLQYARLSRLESDATFPCCLAAAAMDRLDAWPSRQGSDGTRFPPWVRGGCNRMSIAVTRGTHRHCLTNSARQVRPATRNAFPRDCSKRPAKGHEKLVPEEACLRECCCRRQRPF